MRTLLVFTVLVFAIAVSFVDASCSAEDVAECSKDILQAITNCLVKYLFALLTFQAILKFLLSPANIRINLTIMDNVCKMLWEQESVLIAFATFLVKINVSSVFHFALLIEK